LDDAIAKLGKLRLALREFDVLPEEGAPVPYQESLSAPSVSNNSMQRDETFAKSTESHILRTDKLQKSQHDNHTAFDVSNNKSA